MKKNLILLGMMGVGKSTIAKILAKKLKFKLLDTDKLIEKKNKMKIIEIFNLKGEKFFRDEEEFIVNETIKNNPYFSVVALGGGAFLNKKNRSNILSNGVSFWLDNNLDALFLRLKKSYKRPLLKENGKKILEETYKKRKAIYKLANYKINCNKLKLSEICSKILNYYEKK